MVDVMQPWDVDTRFFIAFLAPTVGFAVWFVKRLLDERREACAVVRARDNLVRALFAEIDFNTRDMEIFLDKSRSLAAISDAIRENPELIPHITDARHTIIYRSRIPDLHEVSDTILAEMIVFYGLLEKIREQILAIQRPSFGTISAEGRISAIHFIHDTALDAKHSGLALLDGLSREYAQLRLARSERRSQDSLSSLSSRMMQLELRLKTARSANDFR